MFKGPGKLVRDNKSSSYPVFELTGVNCNSKCEKLLGGKVNNKLSFNAHSNRICKKAELNMAAAM